MLQADTKPLQRQIAATTGCGLTLRRAPLACCALLLQIILCLSGCAQKMGSQPAYRPLEQSDFFRDGQASRKPPDKTVPRRDPLGNDRLNAARMAPTDSGGQNLSGQTAAQTSAQSPNGEPLNRANAAEVFPLEITEKVLARGRERYDIYCSVCHGLGGYGDGIIVQRGFSQPPSFHTDRLRGHPASHFYEVISKGFGAMSGYGVQVEPQDRWAIIAYIRALQLSQHANLAEVPPEAQSKFNSKGQP